MKHPPPPLIGILTTAGPALSDAARERLGTADVVIGAGRTLDLVVRTCSRPNLKDMDGQLTKVPDWPQAALAENRTVAILATGDPLCHGIAASLLSKLDAPLGHPAQRLDAPTRLRALPATVAGHQDRLGATARTPASGSSARRRSTACIRPCAPSRSTRTSSCSPARRTPRTARRARC